MIVATSTLELGIDVGDLDRVIQIDAPTKVASFLLRLGRTGRRSGTTRNCLFLTTNPHALGRAAAIEKLWRDGWVEPVTPPPFPVHIYAQQTLSGSFKWALSLTRNWLVLRKLPGIARYPVGAWVRFAGWPSAQHRPRSPTPLGPPQLHGTAEVYSTPRSSTPSSPATRNSGYSTN